MGIVLDLVAALRRRAGGTLSSALQRQNQQLEGQTVLSRSRQALMGGDGETVEMLVASVEPRPERVSRPSPEDQRALDDNAARAPAFLAAFGVSPGEVWTPDALDLGFARWQAAGDRQGYSDEFVVQALGALFGDFCNRQLGMQWAVLEDEYGTCLMIDGVAREFRGFPFETIRKRIDAAEAGFFRSVYTVLEHQAGEARLR